MTDKALTISGDGKSATQGNLGMFPKSISSKAINTRRNHTLTFVGDSRFRIGLFAAPSKTDIRASVCIDERISPTR